MKILFLSHFFYPHVGGVEKHVSFLSEELIKERHEITIVTERFDKKLKLQDNIGGIKVVRFDYPIKKFIGIFYIWLLLWQKRVLILESDVIHVHDVFIWYLPFRFLFFWKKVFVTIHGLEWGNPLSFSGIIQKRLAIKLSKGSIGVGKFIEKYIHEKFTILIYGAVNIRKVKNKKRKNSIVFVGRLSTDTGILEFLKYLDNNQKLKPIFVGDGNLRKKCEKYGKVYGFTNPEKFLDISEYVVPGGYLACFEAFGAKCKVKVFWRDELKKDYWQMSPMYKFIKDENVNEAYNWVKKYSWEKLFMDYLYLWMN